MDRTTRSGDRRSGGWRITRAGGFTLLELIIVVTIIGILATLAQPMYTGATQKARETVLRENLFAIREVIDQYYADRGKYPGSLEELVTSGYLRKVPEDPIAKNSTSWVTVPPPGDMEEGGVFDVKSGAAGTGTNGIPYAEW